MHRDEGIRVDADDPPGSPEHDHRQEQPDGHERPPRAGGLDEQRRQERADADGEVEHRLHDAEHAGEHVVRRDSLEERETGDVDERVADADERERSQGHADIRPRRDGDERQAPEHGADDERDGQPGAMHEGHDDDGADEGSQADGRVQQAHAALTDLQQRERGDDDEDVDAAGRQRLAGEHARQQAEVGRPPCHAEAGEHELPERRMTTGARHGRRLLDRQHEQRRPEQRDGHDDERRLHAGDGEHEARERRADEHPKTLDRGRDDVGHRQLLGSARELREDGDLSRSKRRAHGRGQPREDVDERDRSVGDDDGERAEHEERADEVAREHHPHAAVAIPECRGEGRSERA